MKEGVKRTRVEAQNAKMKRTEVEVKFVVAEIQVNQLNK